MITFQEARDGLKRLGVLLEQSPGVYRLSYVDGPADTQPEKDNLHDALTRGCEMALEPRPDKLPPLGPLGSSARGKLRGTIYRHNKKIAARRARAAKRSDD